MISAYNKMCTTIIFSYYPYDIQLATSTSPSKARNDSLALESLQIDHLETVFSQFEKTRSVVKRAGGDRGGAHSI